MADYSNIPRDSRRVPLATKVQFKFDRFSGFISEYSANISPTGMFIVASSPEPPGRVLDLEFRLGDGFEIITGKGEVVWSRTVADGPERPPGMGLRFTDLSEGSKDLIYRIVDRYVQQGGVPFDLSSARERTPAEPAAAPVVSFPAAPAAPATPTPTQLLPPLELEPDPFPDLDVEPVKDSSGNALPWFSSGAAAPPPPPVAAPPADEAQSELFQSIGPALEEVEKSFAGEPPAPLLFPSALPAPARPAPPVAPADPFADLVVPAPPSVRPLPAQEPEPIAAPAMFSDYLPKTAPARQAPRVRPLASLAGSAAAQEPRRAGPWVLLGVLVVVGAAAFLLRERLPVWLGLTGGEEESVQAGPPRRLPSRAEPSSPLPVAQDAGLTSEPASSSPVPPSPPSPSLAPSPPPAAPTPAPVQAAAPPVPEVVQRRPPAAATAGYLVTVIQRITYEESFGGTDIVLWGDGAIRPEAYVSSRMGSPPRELIRLLGIRRPFTPERIQVGTGEVRQVRVGYHAKPGGDELHVVIDLAAPGVKVTRIDQDGQRLRIHLQKG